MMPAWHLVSVDINVIVMEPDPDEVISGFILDDARGACAVSVTFHCRMLEGLDDHENEDRYDKNQGTFIEESEE